jgi:hypothetical protein
MFNSHKGKLTEAAASRELKLVVAAGLSRLTAVELKRATGISKSHVGRLLVGEVGIIRIEEHGISYWCSGEVATTSI